MRCPSRSTNWPPDRRVAEETEIVVYCRGEYCVLAYDAVRLLTDLGRRAIRLNDSMLEWRLAELPVDAVD
ncbi:rhodanese-like domain-containing protein [Streptomyces sp. FXJ1.4098]|nr:rhodanese-like domain-containing protein [Streptomyces sp. FXJ1.4098]